MGFKVGCSDGSDDGTMDGFELGNDDGKFVG